MAVINASSGTIQAFVIDNKLRASRADGQSMTETDWSNVYQHFKSLPEVPAAAVPIPVGEIVALLIDSTVIGAPIWFAHRDNWQPDEGDSTPVFYASELSYLRTKTPKQLRSIFNVKAAFGPGSWVRQ